MLTNLIFALIFVDDRPIDYWRNLPSTSETSSLKNLVIKILEIFPHAGGVEGLFSLMSLMKSKGQNQMKVQTLKMISQVRLGLSDAAKHSQKSISTKKKNASENDLTNDDAELFVLTDELEIFEDGIEPIADELSGEFEGFMDTLFDFSLFKQKRNNVSSFTPTIVVEDEPSSWSAADLFDV